MDHDSLGYQGRTPEKQRSMHLVGGITGILFLIAIPTSVVLYLITCAL